MAPCFRILFLLTLTASVRSQFFADFFQGLQSYVTNRPPIRQIYDQTTRRTTEQTRNYFTQTTKSELTTKGYEDISSQFNNWEEQENRRKNYNYTTTKPRRTKISSRRVINSDKVSQDNSKEYDGKINSISDYYTQKPKANSYRATESANRNYYTTNNPLVNRPGVRPVVVDNRPPITNRPVTRRPNYGVNPRPKDEDSILFPDDEDESPELIIGPDEDIMSAVEKKRYIDVAERMCDKYKAIGTRAVQAIPLLPSPEPVNLNVSSCAPTTVPLVVGGKVVGVQEFPHMALLGWRKIQAAGYSWKCGGSLVSEQFVLTAAHCSFQDRDNTVVNGPPRAVQLGSSYLDDPGALVVRVASVVRHPKYKQPRSYYDLALVKMVNAVKFSELIKPACLGVPPAVGKSIIATGWGRTEYGGEQSHELRSVSLPVWAMTRCREVLGTSRRLPDGPSADSQLCAGEEQGGKDTCQGDSGGPAQMQEGCIWRVVAVTSLGRSCGAAETPGLYALVHRAFVASQIFANQNYNSQNNGDNNSQNYGNNDSQNSNNRNQGTQRPSSNNYDRQDGYNPQVTTRRPASNNNNYNNQNYGNDRQQGTTTTTTRRPASNNDSYNNQNYGINSYNPRGTTTRRPASINNDNYNNQNYGNDRQQRTSTRRPASNNNYNNQGNDRQDSNNPQGITTKRPASINNYNYNNQNYGNDRQQGTSTRRPASNNNYNNQGNDRQDSYNRQGTTTRHPASNNNNYNNQNYGNDRQDYNRPQASVTQQPTVNNDNNYNGQNNYNNAGQNSNINYNRPEDNVYNTQRPDRNVADQVYNNGQNYETDSTNYNGNNNRQQNYNSNNYNQPPVTQRPLFENSNYGTQKPSRINNGGIINNNYNDYNRPQSNQYEYTTRNPIRTNNRNGGVIIDYTNNNRDQTNYNSDNYGSTIDNNRRTDHVSYTVSKPWWLTY